MLMILYLYPSEKNLVSVNSNPPPTGRHMSHAKKLIVTANTPSANTSRMLDAVARGANIESIDLQVIAPDVLQPEDLISSNGLILGTTENLGYMAGTIKDIFENSYQSYGSPRIKAELKALGFKVSKPRVARIMKANYLYAKRKRKFRATTDSNHKYPTAPNLLNQCFNVARVNQVWVSDITYVQTNQGWSYLTVIIDLFNRKVIGWALSDTLNTEDTVIKAWQMAIKNTTLTQPLIFHSDQGIQYASQRFTNLLKSYNDLVKQSMSRKGNCWDNAVAESFFKSLKVEWVYWHKYKLKSQAELSIFQWIETWYNTRRRHSYLGNRTIKEFEIDMYNQKLAA